MVALVVVGVVVLIAVAAVSYNFGISIGYKDSNKISEEWVDEISRDMRRYGVNPPPNPFKKDAKVDP